MNVFEVYYLPNEKPYHYHKKSYISVVDDAVELFFSGRIKNLEDSLNLTKDENKHIYGDFFFKNHDYGFSPKRSLRQLRWLFWTGLPLSILILWMGAMFLFIGGIAGTTFGLIIMLISFIFWLPGVILHYNYIHDIAELTIRVTKGQDTILAKSAFRERKFMKSDITQITKHQILGFRNPWGEYGFTQILFTSGEVINLTNLIVDQLYVLDKFSSLEIEKQTVYSRFPLIKLKTRIDGL